LESENGQELCVRLRDDKEFVNPKEIETWEVGVREWLLENLGEGYGARFRERVNIPKGVEHFHPTQQLNLWTNVQMRITRLNEFIRGIGRE